jgi:hypothetical protein
VTAGQDCIVIDIESVRIGTSVWVAGNTVCAQCVLGLDAFVTLEVLANAGMPDVPGDGGPKSSSVTPRHF